MEKSRWGVHESHCCQECGCKYGDEDCPVATGKTVADYDCFECSERESYLVAELSLLSEERFAEIVKRVILSKEENNE